MSLWDVLVIFLYSECVSVYCYYSYLRLTSCPTFGISVKVFSVLYMCVHRDKFVVLLCISFISTDVISANQGSFH